MVQGRTIAKRQVMYINDANILIAFYDVDCASAREGGTITGGRVFSFQILPSSFSIFRLVSDNIRISNWNWMLTTFFFPQIANDNRMTCCNGAIVP